MRSARIIVVALGGTIAMTPDPNAGGATPTLSGEAIVRAVRNWIPSEISWRTCCSKNQERI